MNSSLKLTLLSVAAVGGLGVVTALNSTAPSQSETIENSARVVFPLSMPGDTIQILKVMDDKGAIVLQSNSPLVKTPDDLVKLERKEYDAKKKKYGAMSDGLVKKIVNSSETDSFLVQVSLKIKTNGSAPDKTKHPMDTLIEWAKKDLQRIPVIDKGSFIKKHGLPEATVPDQIKDKSFKNSNNLMILRVNKKMLAELCFDENVVSVEEYKESHSCVVSCVPCSLKGTIYSTPPCFATLATSAYNPTSLMPSNSKGQGVNAATFETGLRQQFVNCVGLGSNLKKWDAGGTDPHSNQTFRCMTKAAPQANFYHRASLTFHTQDDENYILQNSIQTVSMSWENNQDPTEEEMRRIDSWAYRPPYTVFCNPTANDGYCQVPDWRCYNAINVGNVQHYNETHYVLNDTALDITQPPENCTACGNNCNGHCTWGTTQTANPPPFNQGAYIPNILFDCSSCNPGTRGDRELPMIVAPGISPVRYLNGNPVQYPQCGESTMSDPCIYGDYPSNYRMCESEGTSYSAPITNGIAACVISADSRMIGWPEKVRAALLLTAQNVDFNYWSFHEDGRDGAGVISGANAVFFAKNHRTVYPGGTADTVGLCATSLYNSNQGNVLAFNIKIPNPLPPSGKHLRIVLTWDSSPAKNSDINDLSDLDLTFQGNSQYYSSLSYESNIEMVDVDRSQVTAGNTYTANVSVVTMRITPPPQGYADHIYYAIGWTWVKDHAN
jgi:hypothetical protein